MTLLLDPLQFFETPPNRFYSERSVKKALGGLSSMASRLTNRAYPLWAYIILTRRCNLSCSYCYVTKDKFKEMGLKGANNEMPLSELTTAIDKLSSLGTRWISFFGGEPTIRRHELVECIKYANSLRVFTQLATNGVLLEDDSYVADLGKAGIDLIDVSLDSLADFNESRKDFRHRPNLFNALFAGRAKHGFAIKTNYVLTKRNIDQLESVMDFAHQNNVLLSLRLVHKSPMPAPPWSANNELYFSDDASDIEAIDRAVGIILDRKKAGYVTTEPCAYYETIRGFVRGRRGLWSCDAGKYHLTINCDGKIMQCSLMLSQFPITIHDLDERFFQKIGEEVTENLKVCNDTCIAAAYFCGQHYRKNPLSILEQGFLP